MTKDELYAQIRENYNELKTALQAEDANHFLFLAQYRKNHEWVTRLTRSGCFLEKASGVGGLHKREKAVLQT